MKLVYSYLRVSPTKRDQAENSIERQELVVRDDYKDQEVELVFFKDERISGKSIAGRKDYLRMLDAIKIKKPDEIAITKVDRAFRSFRDMIDSTDDWIKQEIIFKSLKENITTDKTDARGLAFMQMLGVFAELERKMIVERITDGIREKAEALHDQGSNWGAKKVILDKEKVLDLYNNQGKTMMEIATEMHCSTKPIWKIINGKR